MTTTNAPKTAPKATPKPAPAPRPIAPKPTEQSKKNWKGWTAPDYSKR